MNFEHLKQPDYLDTILSIIRKGIKTRLNSGKICKKLVEDLITEDLAKEFNIIGMQLEEQKIACMHQNKREKSLCSEDIYFYLTDSNRTKIFFVEAKCLPQDNSKKGELESEYIVGTHSTKSKSESGGIQRYKSEKHGYSNLRHNAMIAYIKEYSTLEWFTQINEELTNIYPEDSNLVVKSAHQDEYISTHKYNKLDCFFHMHHFWIDLTVL